MVVRRPRLRDLGGLPALLRARPGGHLPPHRRGGVGVPRALFSAGQRPRAEAADGGPVVEDRVPRGGRGGREEAPLVQRGRLGAAGRGEDSGGRGGEGGEGRGHGPGSAGFRGGAPGASDRAPRGQRARGRHEQL